MVNKKQQEAGGNKPKWFPTLAAGMCPMLLFVKLGLAYVFFYFLFQHDPLDLGLKEAIVKAKTPIVEYGTELFEKNQLPDSVFRWAVRDLLEEGIDRRSERDLGREGTMDFLRSFREDIGTRAIAEETDDANVQHYEVPSKFYEMVLGKHNKYSSGLYPYADFPVAQALEGLDEAEERMFQEYATKARIHDMCSVADRTARVRVLDLGCGWGSLSLWIAENFRECVDVVGLSNSKSQKVHILGKATERGLTNVDVMTGDISQFTAPEGMEKFDLVISIEMFEHMKNYKQLMSNIARDFSKPDGLLFVHIFTTDFVPYHFVASEDPKEWMATFFFSGGTMPSDTLLLYMQDDFAIQDHWNVNGKHYSLTLEAWLQKMDSLDEKTVLDMMTSIYGEGQGVKWIARWRGFFMACSELFKAYDGKKSLVSHYLFKNRA